MTLNDALESVLAWIEGQTGVAYSLTDIQMAENSMAEGDESLRGFKVISRPHIPAGANAASMVVASYSIWITGVVISTGTESLYGALELKADSQGFVVIPVVFYLTLTNGGTFVHTIHFAFKDGRLFSVE